MIGEIYPKGTLLLRKDVGTAKAPDDETGYEMSLVNGYVPCIHSEKTGKYFLVDWNKLIHAAVEAGIDSEG